MVWLIRFRHDNRGQDMIEYALILAFIALSGAAMLVGMNTSMSTIWSVINSRLNAASN